MWSREKEERTSRENLLSGERRELWVTRMNSIEAEGKTTKEAIRLALKKLGVPRNKVEIKILSEEDKGLFGMEGAKLAKVRVTVKEGVE